VTGTQIYKLGQNKTRMCEFWLTGPQNYKNSSSQVKLLACLSYKDSFIPLFCTCWALCAQTSYYITLLCY